MLHPDVARHLHEQRLREVRRHWPVIDRLAATQATSQHGRRRTLRRVLGRTIVRIGTAIEAEPRQPVASR
jgi:hypothetical protein